MNMVIRSIDSKESELIIRQIADRLAVLTDFEATHRPRFERAMAEFEEERVRTSRLMMEYATQIEKLSSEAADLREKMELLRAENVFLAGYIRDHVEKKGGLEAVTKQR